MRKSCNSLASDLITIADNRISAETRKIQIPAILPINYKDSPPAENSPLSLNGRKVRLKKELANSLESEFFSKTCRGIGSFQRDKHTQEWWPSGFVEGVPWRLAQTTSVRLNVLSRELQYLSTGGSYERSYKACLGASNRSEFLAMSSGHDSRVAVIVRHDGKLSAPGAA